jgi:shikimate dehydrogenase
MLDASTQLFGIFVHPAGHSLSPVMQNAAFQATGENAVFLAFDLEDIEKAVAALRTFKMRGAAISIPHKISILPYLDALDPLAEKIGAVNTVVNDGGKLTGYNTDAFGAVRAIEVGAPHFNFTHKNAVILGGGGTARAIAFALQERECRITILNRTLKKARELADLVGGNYGELDDLVNIDANLIVNATSVGMHPKEGTVPVPPEAIRPHRVVFDVVYRPLKTRLMQIAEARNCTTISGIEMLLYQGVKQFELWTGKTAPVEVMRKALAVGQ